MVRDGIGETNALRTSGAGKAIVGAVEEVLCWDVKKGELVSRWKDSDCKEEVTVIVRSRADPEVFAVGYSTSFSTPFSSANRLETVMMMVGFDYGILESQRSSLNSMAIDLLSPP